MKIYTKTGDKGTTSLFDKTRVSKDDPRVGAYGDVDELNAMLGICLSDLNEKDVRELLIEIQRDLFALGAQLANPSHKKQRNKTSFTEEKIRHLEDSIDKFEAELKPVKDFMLPGGNSSSARLHFARTICRRAERKIVSLMKNENVDNVFLVYMNRLSDLLFVLARVMNKRGSVKEVSWSS